RIAAPKSLTTLPLNGSHAIILPINPEEEKLSQTVPFAVKPSPIARFFRFIGNMIAAAILLGIVLTAGGIAMLIAPGPYRDTKTVIVPKGSGNVEIGRILRQNGVVYNEWQFALPAHLIGHGGLRAGEYQLTPEMSVLDIIGKLRAGETVVHKISI